jgi:hypothetical protein
MKYSVGATTGDLTTNIDSLQADIKADGSLSGSSSEQVKTSVLLDVLKGEYTLETVVTMILIDLRE